MTGAEELLLAAAWARSNVVDGEDILEVMVRKMLHTRRDEAIRRSEQWERTATSCEKQLTKLDKLAEKRDAN